jgi:hypothetical protein
MGRAADVREIGIALKQTSVHFKIRSGSDGSAGQVGHGDQ